MEYKLLRYDGKRPNNSLKMLKRELIYYIHEEIKQNHFPSRRELEKNFHLKLDSMFSNIYSLYKAAGSDYKITPNQFLKSEKADLLLKLILKKLNKFDLNLIKYRKVRERGIDIIGTNEHKKVGIEIKAYNKYEMLKKKDIDQVKKFLFKENLDEVIIITTTNLQNRNIEILGNVRIVKYPELRKLLSDYKEINILSYIRNYSVNRKDTSKEIKRSRILNYVLLSYQNSGKKPGYNNILRDLNLDIYTYFKSLFEIYKILGIPPPLKNMPGKRARKVDNEIIELWKDEFKRYIMQNVKEGKYPSGEEIANHFNISNIWNIVKVSDLYIELGLKPYLERKRLH